MDIKSVKSNVPTTTVAQLKDAQVKASVAKEEKKSVEQTSGKKEDTVKISAQALDRQKEASRVDNTKTEQKNVEKTSVDSQQVQAERSQKVAQLKEQIKNGEFKVDSKAIANKLVENKEGVSSLVA